MAQQVMCLSALFMLMCYYTLHGEAAVLNKKDVKKYNTCDDILRSGLYKEDGSYLVFLNSSQPFEVHCRFELGYAYTSIMQQKYGRESFERGWNDYLYGFGNPARGDFWTGLLTIRHLSDTLHCVLTITMQDWTNEVKILQYRFFKVDALYRLHLGQYQSGRILPDDFSHNNGMVFATYDRPDSKGCAVHQRAGWWYNYCTYALPTGKYYEGGHYTPTSLYYDGIYFNDWHGFSYSLKYIKLELSTY